MITGRLLRKILLASCAFMALGEAAPGDGALAPAAFGDEYAAVGYTTTPVQNPLAQLAARIDRSEAKLTPHPQRSYLDAVLEELEIDPASQILVYSRTSLQINLISALTPRAIYFNDSTYVAWIPGSKSLEIVTMDAALGPVFYVLGETAGTAPEIRRHTGTCLVCHDNFNGKGGGTPRLLSRSVLSTVKGIPLEMPTDVTDATPLEMRWAGWYVTGREGKATHRGNLQIDGAGDLAHLDRLRRGNLATLEGAGLFDTSPYLVKTSDIVALLIMEHQTSVQNQLTFIRYKAPAILARVNLGEAAAAQTWEELPAKAKSVLKPQMELLVKRLTFTDAAPLPNAISGTAGFERGFQAKGPKDGAGRSLRELDLRTRLMRYPLSYLIYSPEFDALPAFARDYVYRSLAQAVRDEDAGPYNTLAPEERRAMREILIDTVPAFRAYQ